MQKYTVQNAPVFVSVYLFAVTMLIFQTEIIFFKSEMV